jgi:hypothetical protein
MHIFTFVYGFSDIPVANISSAPDAVHQVQAHLSSTILKPPPTNPSPLHEHDIGLSSNKNSQPNNGLLAATLGNGTSDNMCQVRGGDAHQNKRIRVEGRTSQLTPDTPPLNTKGMSSG